GLEHVTGVRTRRWASPEVQPSELAAAAGEKALARAGLDPLEVDTLIFAGITRDCLEPATANLVAEAVGARNARVFDLITACNSLVDAIDVGDSLIRSGKAERILVATGERASLAINWQAQTMEELLQSVASLVVGDGGGAVVLEPSDDPGRGLRAREFRSDATQWRHAIGGRFRPGTQACQLCGGLLDPTFRCNGRDLFAAAFSLLYPTMETVMARTGWGSDELVAAVHLANRAVLRAFVEVVDTMAGRAALEVVAGEGGLFPEDVAAAVATVPGVEVSAASVKGAAFADGGTLVTVYGVDLTGDV